MITDRLKPSDDQAGPATLSGKRIAFIRLDVYTRGSDMMAQIVARRLRENGAHISIFHGRGRRDSRFPLDRDVYRALACGSVPGILMELALRRWDDYDYLLADFAPLAWTLGLLSRRRLILFAQSDDVEYYNGRVPRTVITNVCRTLMKRWRLPVMCTSAQLAQRLRDKYGASVALIDEGELSRLFAFEQQARQPTRHTRTRPLAVMGIVGKGYAKGADILQQVFEDLDRRLGAELEFLVAGLDCPWRFRKARMRHFGFLDQAKIFELYRSADAFVFTSRLENFPSPPFEAMLCGCPVVSTPVAEYLEDGANALVVSPKRPCEIADAVAAALNDAELTHRLRSGGNNTVRALRNRLRGAATAAEAFVKCARQLRIHDTS